jgi:transglutaminase-like putative cysteine protease
VLTTPARPTLTATDGARAKRPGDPRAPQRHHRIASGDAAASAALAVLTVVSAWGLFRVFQGDRWIGPVVVTALVVHSVCWAARRLRVPSAVAAVIGVLTVGLTAVWTVIGATTSYGIPTGTTLTTAYHLLQTAYDDVATVVPPVQATHGFVLAAAIGVGLVACIGDWLAFRVRSAVWASAPAFAFFMVCCVVGFGPGRQLASILEAGGLISFILLHRTSAAGVGVPWLGGTSAGAARWALPVGALVAAAAMLVVVAVAPASQGVEGSGLLGWHVGGTGGGGPRQVANPIVDLRTRLINLSDVGVLTVRSQVPSYWRLTSLDTFTGEAWIATNSYRGFGSRLPGVSAVPAGTRTVQEQFHVEALESVWLPVAFTPVSVTGVHGVGYDPTSSSLITSHKTSDGLNYTVTSYQYLSTLDPAQLDAAPPLKNDAFVSHYLSLPQTVPESVYALARQVTAGKQTEYDKAVALQDFFLGPSFQYSLNPPSDGPGIDALQEFLFGTRSGYCQQFAGAYAVLARAVGLPTRLAVGFTSGTLQSNGLYQVVDADAHTWPEVYFGPKIGWVPFEPTKSFSDPTAQGYAPPLPSSVGPTTPSGEPTAPAPKNSTPTTSGGGANRTSPTTTAIPGSHAGGRSAISGGWAAILVIGGLLAAWVAGNVGARRLRWRIRRWRDGGEPGSRVLSHWNEVAEVLAWWGVSRSPSETDAEFAGRAGRSLSTQLHEPSPWVTFGVTRMASLATEAAFAPSLHVGAANEAALVAQEIRQRLMRTASARRLIMWALIQRPGRGAGH